MEAQLPSSRVALPRLSFCFYLIRLQKRASGQRDAKLVKVEKSMTQRWSWQRSGEPELKAEGSRQNGRGEL